MKSVLILALFFAVGAQAQDTGQSFRLAPGDLRWIPVNVRQTPTEIEGRFDVIEGSPTVHMELVPISEFRPFTRGEEHTTLALTTPARTGRFRRVIDTRGRYALILANGKNAPPATVTLDLRMNVNPSNSDVARTISPQRRLVVILLSFAFFFVTVTWSSRKLIRAMRGSGR
jgi:hypothetical protein